MGLLGDAWNIVGSGANAIGEGASQIPGLAMDALTGGAYSNTQAAQNINTQNIGYAQKQMDFQERMSSTAYQRATEDMRKSGLNPMLAYSQGGATAPSGAAPDLQNPNPGNIGAGLFNSGKAIIEASAGVQNTTSATKKNLADVDTADTVQQLNTANTQKAKANAQESEANRSNTMRDTQLKSEQQVKTSHESRRAKSEADQSELELKLKKERFDYDKKMQKFDSISDRAGPVIKGAAEAIGAGAILKRVLGAQQSGPTTPTYDRYDPKTWRYKNAR